MSDLDFQTERSYPEFADRLRQLHSRIVALIDNYGEKYPDGTAGISFTDGAPCASMWSLPDGRAKVVVEYEGQYQVTLPDKADFSAARRLNRAESIVTEAETFLKTADRSDIKIGSREMLDAYFG